MAVHIVGAEQKTGRAYILSGDIEVGIIHYSTTSHRDLPHDLPPKNIYIGYIEIYPQHRGRGFGVDAVEKFMSIRKRVGDNFIAISPSPGLEGWWGSLGFEPLNTYYFPSGSSSRMTTLFMGRNI